MRAPRRFGMAIVVVGMVVAGCSDSEPDEASGSTTTGASTSATTSAPSATTTTGTGTAPPTSESPPTTAVATTTASASTSSEPGAAELSLAGFLVAYDGLAVELPRLTQEVQASIDASGTVAGELVAAGEAAAGGVYGLARLVPPGLDPSVARAVHDATFVMGQAAGAFLFAPGWAAEEWPDWTVGMDAAQAQLATMREVVVAAAAAAPEMTPVAPGSRSEAEVSVLELELIRTFGHGGPGIEVDAVPAAVRWLGALPSPAATGTDCFVDLDTAAPRVPVGDFVDGEGGCAIVFYDGDLEGHEADVSAWLAAPSIDTLPPGGEFAAFVLTEAGWEPRGSAE